MRLAATAMLALLPGCVCLPSGGFGFSGRSSRSVEEEPVEPEPVVAVTPPRATPGATVETRVAEGTTEEVIATIRSGRMGGFRRFTDATLPPAGDLRIFWDTADGRLGAILRYDQDAAVDCVILARSEAAMAGAIGACNERAASWTPAPIVMVPGWTHDDSAEPGAPAVAHNLPWLALDIGLEVHTETAFHDCTNPEGGGASLIAGIGVREGSGAFYLRGGLSGGAMKAHHADEMDGVTAGEDEEGRAQSWAGLAFQHTNRRGGTVAITGFTTRTVYTRGKEHDVAHGGGLSLDLYSRATGPSLMLSGRLVADAEGVSGSLGLGFVLRR